MSKKGNQNKTKLPTNWVRVDLGEVVDIFQGYGFPKDIQGKSFGKYPFFKVGDISKNVLSGAKFLKYCDNYIDDQELDQLRAVLLPPDTIVFAKIGEGLKLNRRAITTTECLIDNNLVGVKPQMPITSNFIFEFLKTVDLGDLSQATTVPSVRKSDIEKISLPLPPLSEQHRIVDKLERLFARLARAEAALAAAEVALECYRQSVLNEAFKADDEEGNLKEGWKWVKLGEVVDIVSGNTPKELPAKSENGEFDFYKVSDMNLPGNELFMVTSNISLTLSQVKALKLKIFPKQTVIFPKRGGAILTNKKRILSKEASFDLNIMGLIPRKINPGYLFYWVQSLDLATIYDGSNVPQINNKHIEPLIIPVPSDIMQVQIVEQIRPSLDRASSLKLSLELAQSNCVHLRQSILQETFRGRLTSQIDGDEPATDLLEKIKKEREKREKNAKQRSKAPSKKIERKNMEKVTESKSILEILKAAEGVPVKAQTVWLQSEYKDNIDKFYEALKELIEIEKTVRETREGDISYLILNDEN